MLQDGREARLGPGTGGLVPPAAPLRVVRHRGRALVLTIPAHERLNLPARPLTGLDLTAWLGRVVADMVRAVGEERDTLSAPQFDAACDRITELLCLIVAGRGRARPRPAISPRWRRSCAGTSASTPPTPASPAPRWRSTSAGRCGRSSSPCSGPGRRRAS